MINGRTKVFEFEKKLADRLQITIQCKAGKNYDRIFRMTKQMIDANQPVLIYVDMPFLPYLGLADGSHFGGHAVVLFGYDVEMLKFLVSDRDQHDALIYTPNGQIAEDFHMVITMISNDPAAVAFARFLQRINICALIFRDIVL